jgi:hypothetical protein
MLLQYYYAVWDVNLYVRGQGSWNVREELEFGEGLLRGYAAGRPMTRRPPIEVCAALATWLRLSSGSRRSRRSRRAARACACRRRARRSARRKRGCARAGWAPLRRRPRRARRARLSPQPWRRARPPWPPTCWRAGTRCARRATWRPARRRDRRRRGWRWRRRARRRARPPWLGADGDGRGLGHGRLDVGNGIGVGALAAGGRGALRHILGGGGRLDVLDGGKCGARRRGRHARDDLGARAGGERVAGEGVDGGGELGEGRGLEGAGGCGKEVANNKGQLGGGVKQAGSLCLTFFPSSASRAPTSADSWPCNSSPNILFLYLSSRTHTLRPRVTRGEGRGGQREERRRRVGDGWAAGGEVGRNVFGGPGGGGAIRGAGAAN